MKHFYRKPFLTFEQQADQLIDRGLHVQKKILMERLSEVSYFRLSAYWYSFRKNDPDHEDIKIDTFEEGTSFDAVWERYRFDRKLRFLLLDAVERIEISLRTKLIYYFTQSNDAFAYTDSSLFPKWIEHCSTIKKMEYQSGFKNGKKKGRTNGKRDTFLNHFLEHYCNAHLPFWMLAELMDFGTMSRFIEHLDTNLKKRIAQDFDLPLNVFLSWLCCLNSLRNSCAHHSRIWNKEWGTKPLFPNYGRQKEWFYLCDPTSHQWTLPSQKLTKEKDIKCVFSRAKTAALIIICRYFQKRIIPCSEWSNRISSLLDEFVGTNIKLCDLGLPEHWKEHPLWKIPKYPLCSKSTTS